MRRIVLFAFFLLVACASATDSAVSVRIVDTNITSDIRYVTAVAIRFHVEVTNPTSETTRLRKIEIHTPAAGAFSVRVENSYDREVAPGQTIAIEINGTGASTGGRFAPDEPVTFRGTAYFDSQHGAFVKMFQYVSRVQ